MCDICVYDLLDIVCDCAELLSMATFAEESHVFSLVCAKYWKGILTFSLKNQCLTFDMHLETL